MDDLEASLEKGNGKENVEAKKSELSRLLKEAYENGGKLNGKAMQGKGNPYSYLYYRAVVLYKDKGKFFWETALSNAGLPLDKIIIQKVWDKDRIKNSLVGLYNNGEAINSHAIHKKHADLHCSIFDHFDSYDDALIYAGFDPKKIRKHEKPYEKEKIIEEIKKLHKKGSPLSAKKLINAGSKKKRLLAWAGQRVFDGGWREAVEEAGIDYNKYLLREQGWNEKKVLEGIRKLQANKVPLDATYISENYNKLYMAAFRHIGNWEKALTKCGIDYLKVRKNSPMMPDEEIISRIKKLHSEGKKLDNTSIVEDKDKEVRTLYQKAGRRFEGGWNEALEKAGLDPSKIRRVRPPFSIDELKTIVKGLREEGVSLLEENIKNNVKNRKYYVAVARRMPWNDFLNLISPRTLNGEILQLIKSKDKLKNEIVVDWTLKRISQKYNVPLEQVYQTYEKKTKGFSSEEIKKIEKEVSESFDSQEFL